MEQKQHQQGNAHSHQWAVWLVVGSSVFVYIVLACLDAQWYFPTLPSSHLVLGGFQYASSLAVALLFLGVSVLVWIYAYPREVALLLWGTCTLLMLCFVEETAAMHMNQFALLLSQASSQGALWLLVAFLLQFPTPVFRSTDVFKKALAPTCSVLLGLSFVLPCLSVRFPNAKIFSTISHAQYTLGFFMIAIACFWSFRRATTRRTHRQVSLLLIALVIGVGPFLLTTFLPSLFHFPALLIIESQWSTLTMAFLPLLVGYATLEYRLVVDLTMIQRFLKYLTSAIGIALLTYATFVASQLHHITNESIHIYFAIALAFLYPCAWQGFLFGANKIFSHGPVHLDRHFDPIEFPQHLPPMSFDTVLQPYLAQVKHLLETDIVVLLLFDAETGYHLPVFSPQEHPTPQQAALLHSVEMTFASPPPPTHVGATQFLGIAAFHPLTNSLFSALRPLYLSELRAEAQEGGDEKNGMHHRRRMFLDSHRSTLTFDPLVVPIIGTSTTEHIGVLIIGERRDQYAYAAPDFATLSRIHQWFGNQLESGYQETHVQKRTMVLSNIYAARGEEMHTKADERSFLLAFAKIAAVYLDVSVGVWRCADEQGKALHQVAHIGGTPEVALPQLFTPREKEDWLPCFYEGTLSRGEGSQGDLPPCLQSDPEPSFSIAWLPLTSSASGEEKRFGILAFTYPRPHRFSDENEKSFLQIVIQQCVAELEFAREMQRVSDLTVQQQERLTHFVHTYQEQEQERAALLSTLLCTLELLEHATTMSPWTLQALLLLSQECCHHYQPLDLTRVRNAAQSEDSFLP